MKRLICTILLVFLFSNVSGAWATISVFTAEEQFSDRLASMSLTVYFESFESEPWTDARTGVSKPIAVNGLTWEAHRKLAIVNSYSDWVRTGNYGIYNSRGLPDSITIRSANNQKILAAAGWFATSSANTINIESGGSVIASLNIGTNKPHQFLGMIDTEGTSYVTFKSDICQWGADDFTLAIPEPATAMLLALSTPLVFTRRCRKRRGSR